MVRHRLGRHGESLALRRPNELDARRRGDVLDVKPAARFAAEREIAANRLRLGLNGNNRQIELARQVAVADHAALQFLRIHRVLADDDVEIVRPAHRLLHGANRYLGKLDAHQKEAEHCCYPDGRKGQRKTEHGDEKS